MSHPQLQEAVIRRRQDASSTGAAGINASTPQNTTVSGPDQRTTFSNASTIVPIVVIVSVIILLFGGFWLLRCMRKRHAQPKYVPTPYLKRLWTNWRPSRGQSAYRDVSGLENLGASQTRYRSNANFAGASNSAANVAANRAIDRNTSIRSVMTLPAYNPKAAETEQVLGREGERAGIDTVLEFPEGEAEAEELRDEEMEALYQVRVARRDEITQREERQRLRAEARARGDTAALRELRSVRHNNTPSSVETARALHEAVKSRQRTISSVSYADLGVARHDGTRVRANSEESERPLLGDAASIGRSRRLSNATTLSMAHPNVSSSSLMSMAPHPSGDLSLPNLPGGRSRAGSGSSLMYSYTNTTTGTLDLNEHDEFPPYQPPEYINVDLNSETDLTPDAPPEYGPLTDDTTPTNLVTDASETTALPSTADANSEPPVTEHMTTTTQLASSHESPSVTNTEIGTLPPSIHSHAAASRRGVGGMPQLPSLRLSNLPSINISGPSPITRGRRVSEEFD